MAQASSDQRGRLMMTSERLNQSSERIRESQRTVFETEEIGVSILQDLHNQRQSLLHAHTTVCTLFFQVIFIQDFDHR
jgi:vesicle transport through interaction with t-SNAREs protein 1